MESGAKYKNYPCKGRRGSCGGLERLLIFEGKMMMSETGQGTPCPYKVVAADG
jgi:hypothetical protein